MDWDAFERWGEWAVKWAAEYRRGLRDRPVRAQTAPGDVLRALPATPPEAGEPMERILADFERLIPDAMTHWQHPRFFAYFPANAAPPSVLAEILVNAIAAQCMLWQTSPAATELETRMLGWLREAIGLPGAFSGVIQDSASTATLAAVLAMRERALEGRGNRDGLAGETPVRIYSSVEAHSSIERAIWIAGVGARNLARVPTEGARRGMSPEALDSAIRADLAAGLAPAGIVASVGGTGVGAVDDLASIAEVAERRGLYLHVDAAWAGAAMICPEHRDLWRGVERADSVVFNPHKWLGAQFDCTAHFLRDPSALLGALAIRPEYLKTHHLDRDLAQGAVDYSEWSIPLGRRFRALKIWFLIRAYGLDGLRETIRNHVAWSRELAERLRARPEFEIVTEPMLSLFTFRRRPARLRGDAAALDAHNLRLLNAINDDGRIYLTQTKVDGALVIRFQAGSFDCAREDVALAHDVIVEIGERSDKEDAG